MELVLRTFEEDGASTLNADYVVEYYVSGVLTTLNSPGVSSVTISDVDDNSEVSISLTSSGRHTYTKKINVYFVDLDLSVKLIPVITDIMDPNYLNPYPFFFQILNPCTYAIDVYNASSAPHGSGSWYLNNELVDGTGGNYTFVFPGPGNYQLKRRVAVSDPVTAGALLWDRYYSSGATAVGSTSNSVEDNLNLDLNTNALVSEIVPEIDIVINSPGDILNGVTYYNRLETIQIETTFEITSPHVDSNNLVLEYEVIDPDGNRVTPSVEVVNLAVTGPDTSSEFILEKRGDYTINATIVDDCGRHTQSLIVPAYNFIQFQPLQEFDYLVKNQSNTIPISYMVEYLTAQGFVSFKASTDVGTKESDSLTLTSQGIYKITSTFTDGEDNDREEITILHYYGELKDCMTNLTMNILCQPQGGCGCNVMEPTNYLLEIYSLSQVYFMYLQEDYGFNNIYTALDNAQIAQLADIDAVLKKLEKYCKAHSCFDNKSCNCGTCAECLNGTATMLQVISGRTSAHSTATDCGCGGGCSSCGS